MKDHLLVAGLCGATLAVLLFTLAYRPLHVMPASSALFSILAQGASADAAFTSANYVFTSEAEFSTFWAMFHPGIPEPVIDFSKQEVIAVIAPPEPPGAQVLVSGVADESGARVVSITTALPDPDCATSASASGQAATSTPALTPYEVLALPATSLPLSHTALDVTLPCDN